MSTGGQYSSSSELLVIHKNSPWMSLTQVLASEGFSGKGEVTFIFGNKFYFFLSLATVEIGQYSRISLNQTGE